MSCSEDIVLLQIRAGSEHAFRKLFQQYSERFYLWAFKLTQNSYAAEDIVQEFFVRFWERREELTFTPSFSAYAFRAIYHASLNYLRDAEHFVYGCELTLDLADTSNVTDSDVKELNRLLLKAINDLPERCKKVFVMATLEKKKYTEVADLLGISVNTVKGQVSKAYHLLRKGIG